MTGRHHSPTHPPRPSATASTGPPARGNASTPERKEKRWIEAKTEANSAKDTRADAGNNSSPREEQAEAVRMSELQGTAIQVGGNPNMMGLGFGSLWVRDDAEDRVTRIDADTNRVLAVIPLEAGGGFGRLGFGHGSVWITNFEPGTVSRIDPQSNRVEKTISTRHDGPNFVGVTGDAVWIGHSRDERGHVVRIDPASNRVTAEIPLVPRGQEGDLGPMILVGDELWVTGNFGVMRIDPASSRILGEIPIKDGVCPSSVAQSRGRVWIPGCYVDLLAIDAATHHVSRRISTEVRVDAADATEHAVWATDLYGQLLRVDPRRGRIVDSFDLAPVKGQEADAAEIVSDHRSLWIADFPNGRIVRIEEPARSG